MDWIVWLAMWLQRILTGGTILIGTCTIYKIVTRTDEHSRWVTRRWVAATAACGFLLAMLRVVAGIWLW